MQLWGKQNKEDVQQKTRKQNSQKREKKIESQEKKEIRVLTPMYKTLYIR